MQYKLENEVLNSRRGKYQVTKLDANPMIWHPETLDPSIMRHQEVMVEISYANEGRLADHRYWQNEPTWWINQYQAFYSDLFSLLWLHKNEDRHNIVVNADCCLTLVQYHNHRLIAYSRSTDMKNGFYSDKLVLDYLAEYINRSRPDCRVNSIEWYLAVPHTYEAKGIARLIKTDEVKE